jgi:hypothetical protein
MTQVARWTQLGLDLSQPLRQVQRSSSLATTPYDDSKLNLLNCHGICPFLALFHQYASIDNDDNNHYYYYK